MAVSDDKARLILGLRQAGIMDMSLLQVMEAVPHEMFVPPEHAAAAYGAEPLSIGHGQHMLDPLTVARMTAALRLHDRAKVLEIGSGSGYHTAVIAHLCRRVYTVERQRDLYDNLHGRFQRLQIGNVITMLGDGSFGWPQQAPFDAIIVSAASDKVPPPLLEQVIEGGTIVMPIGPGEGVLPIVAMRRTNGRFPFTEVGRAYFTSLESGIGRSPLPS